MPECTGERTDSRCAHIIAHIRALASAEWQGPASAASAASAALATRVNSRVITRPIIVFC